MSYPTYRIETNASRGNSHGVGVRDESWTLRRGPSFASAQEARDYVERLSRHATVLPTLLVDLPDEAAKRAVVEEFCFGDSSRYAAHRRYFVREPDVPSIIAALRADGTRVALSSS